jgi:MYXO-CTERM domain-containing protein
MSSPVQHLPIDAPDVAKRVESAHAAPKRPLLLSSLCASALFRTRFPSRPRQHLASAALACLAALHAMPASADALSAWGTPGDVAPMAAATTTEVAYEVSNIGSFTGFLSAGNFVTFLQVAPFAHVTAIAFDVNLTAFAPSVLSSLAVIFTDSGLTTGVSSRPGFGTNTPGTQTFVGGGDLIAQNLDFAVGGDGRLRLEFVEVFDDPGLAPDGLWNFGTLRFTVSAVPEPASHGLMALGLGGLAGLAGYRRRRGQG